MVQASFSRALRASNLVVIKRDKEAPKGGYSTGLYIKVLENQIPQIYKPSLQFMQDNAPIYRARIIAKQFKENVVEVINQPPYSPNLNPIKHAWVQLKERLHKRFPYIARMHRSKKEVIKELSRALVIYWSKIAPSFFRSLIASMYKRYMAVKEANGWHTRFQTPKKSRNSQILYGNEPHKYFKALELTLWLLHNNLIRCVTFGVA